MNPRARRSCDCRPVSKAASELCVVTNDREVCAEMTRYLAGLGHRRIAFITGDPEHAAVTNRFLGYQDGLADSGLEFSDQPSPRGTTRSARVKNAPRKLLGRKHPPTAIFAANDDMAAGVIRAANRLGVDIPGQLSVAGFDDIALARQVDPSLTTIRQPLVRMAERAAAMLTRNNTDDAGANCYECIPATIKIRESTGPAPA